MTSSAHQQRAWRRCTCTAQVGGLWGDRGERALRLAGGEAAAGGCREGVAWCSCMTQVRTALWGGGAAELGRWPQLLILPWIARTDPGCRASPGPCTALPHLRVSSAPRLLAPPAAEFMKTPRHPVTLTIPLHTPVPEGKKAKNRASGSTLSADGGGPTVGAVGAVGAPVPASPSSAGGASGEKKKGLLSKLHLRCEGG